MVCSELWFPLRTLLDPGAPAAQGSALHRCDLGVLSAWQGCVTVPSTGGVHLPVLWGPPLSGHLCTTSGSPSQHPEAGLPVLGCPGEHWNQQAAVLVA